jgi:NDP-sugar pyrophosphorylase family protein
MKLNAQSMPLNSFFKTHPRVCALVLAGTKGSRLFPMTSSDTPKHLLPIAGIPCILRLLESLSSFPQIVITISAEDTHTLPLVQQVATLRESSVEEDRTWTLDGKDRAQNITIVKLEESIGPVDAMRQVEDIEVIHESTRLVVFPGDFVFLQKYINLDALLRPSSDSACTMLLVDVGELDEYGVPLKESAKVSQSVTFRSCLSSLTRKKAHC